jgi:hypothetical protein
LINGFLGPEESGGMTATGLSILPADFFAAGLVPASAFPFFAGFAAGAGDFFVTGFLAAGLADLSVVAAFVAMEYLFFKVFPLIANHSPDLKFRDSLLYKYYIKAPVL